MRIFKEEQRFTQTWLIILIVVSTIFPVGILLKEYTEENNTMSDSEFLTALSIIIIATCFIFLFKLKTRIDEKGIHYQFFPFHRKLKVILWTEIKSANIRKYDALSEYGGWGLKGGFNRKRGRAINVKGDIGIQLELKNSKKLLIGTQKETEVNQVLKTYQNKLQ